VLFMWDSNLYYYSSQLRLQELEIKGQLQKAGASFSNDGQLIYGWSYSRVETQHLNHWYIWNAATSRLGSETSSPLITPESNKGRDTLVPLWSSFAAFERPNRIYVIGKNANSFDVVQLRRPVSAIVAGVSYRNMEARYESLILVSSNGSFITLQLLPNVDASSPSSPRKLYDGFIQAKDGIALLKQEESIFVVVSHCNGVLERRRVSAN